MVVESEKATSGVQSGIKWMYNGFFSYSSVRTAKVDTFSATFIYRLVQIVILTYIIGWDIVFNKGYQKIDTVSSTVTTKVKGFGSVQLKNGSRDGHFYYDEVGNFYVSSGLPPNFKIFDTADYVIPPNEYNSVFVMSSYVRTEQTPGVCDEDPTKIGVLCNNDTYCKTINQNSWNGIPTGNCIQSTRNSSLKVCEINAWCPVEIDSSSNTVQIQNVVNYTIFIKNDIEFKAFNKRERNILPNITNNYIATCTYNPNSAKYCPVFLIDDVLRTAEPDPNERAQMLVKGGVVQIEIAWICDYDMYKTCQPKYTFSRFDSQFKTTTTASGFNFRFADKYKVNETDFRTLYKAYGLRFIIVVTGQAGKFDIIPLLLTVGSGLGLLSISSLIADFYMSTFAKNRKLFKKATLYEIKDDKDKEEPVPDLNASTNSTNATVKD